MSLSNAQSNMVNNMAMNNSSFTTPNFRLSLKKENSSSTKSFFSRKSNKVSTDNLQEFSCKEPLPHPNVKIYYLSLKHYLLTTRFTNATWIENKKYRDMHPNIGCIYCSPEPISSKIATDKIIFILEMNNDTNKIMGIGAIKNHPTMNKYHVYDYGNYNRYVYVGKNRIDRSEMTEEEELVMKIFDILCFKGNTHMKRAQGLKMFPIDMLYRMSRKKDLVDFITNMFKNRF